MEYIANKDEMVQTRYKGQESIKWHPTMCHLRKKQIDEKWVEDMQALTGSSLTEILTFAQSEIVRGSA